MNQEIASKVSNLSKRYSIGEQKDGSLRGSLKNLFKSVKINKSDFWALQDVTFEINKGDVIGIIGKNGAGKSTLLKILSKITQPTEGRIEINGRVASLLEVGTGFHPELTGRENIFLNGTILGMTRKEVAAKFDEIVEFSGIEKFIDTPVKHYSSGMYVRLAFAVAAHLEPEILIIDEVLAVGDAEFQKKCLGKMKDVAGEGRTVIFVSHNLSAVKALCNKGILIEKGELKNFGNISDTISLYEDRLLNNSFQQQLDLSQHRRERGLNKVKFDSINFNSSLYTAESYFEVELKIKIDENFHIEYLNFGFHILDDLDNQIYHLSNLFSNQSRAKYSKNTSYCFCLEKLRLKPGKYSIWLWLEANGEEQDVINHGIIMEVSNSNVYNYVNSNIISGRVQPDFNFIVKNL